MDTTTRDGNERGIEAAPRIDLPSSLPSFPPASLASLPVETLTHIFQMLPTSPHRERAATLASLSLVNRLFLHIARPLLYHTIRLDPAIDVKITCHRSSQLAVTLLLDHFLASLVKTLKLVLRPDSGPNVYILLNCLLRNFVRLERISTGWDKSEGSLNDSGQLWAAIKAGVPQIKHLEMPHIRLRDPKSSTISTGLKSLETLVFNPLIVSIEEWSTCKFQRVVIMTRLPHQVFRFYLSSAHESLTSLSCQVNYKDLNLLDLSRFPNLSTLRLALGDFHIHEAGSAPPIQSEQQCIDALQTLLRSTRSLALKTVSLATRLDATSASLYNYPLLNVLPPAIQHLSATTDLFGPNNLPFLSLLNEAPPYPFLEHITILPTSFTGELDDVKYSQLLTIQDVVMEYFVKNRVAIKSDLRVKVGDGYGFTEAFNDCTDLME